VGRNQARTQGGCWGCILPTRPKEVLTWHLISLKSIAKKIFVPHITYRQRCLKVTYANNWSKTFLPFIRWAGLVCGTWYKTLEIGIKNQIFLEKPEVCILIPIHLFDSCNDSVFAGMKLTLHKSQVHSYRLCSDELAVQSCPLLCLQRRVAKVLNGLFCSWPLLRKKNMATNLQSSLYIMVAGVLLHETGCWTHTSWQVTLRDSDMLIAVSHVHLYFVKRSLSTSLATLPQVWNIHYQCECDRCAWVSN